MRAAMTEEMRRNLGYDENGNNPRLLGWEDATSIVMGTWRRADQNVVCKCGSEYRLHPQVQGALWLVRTCEGLVKL